MKTLLIFGLTLASLAASAVATAGPVRKEMLIRVDNDWRDCSRWDRRHHRCREADWDRNRWQEHNWYGRRTCRGDHDHDHYLDGRGHWRECR
jgi:hypothetical protein